MSRYIDADKLIKSIPFYHGEYPIMMKAVRAAIDATPTADVVEVRHGTWYHGTEYGSVYAKCSACGTKMNYYCYGYAYCALCGAKMDGERREDK